MRKIKYFVANSLDGFISRADGAVDWILMDQDYGMSSFFASVDVAVMGRKTHDRVRDIAPKELFPPTIKSYVFSRSERSDVLDGMTFVRSSIADWVASIRKEPEQDIWLVGGGEMVRAFLRERLINEVGLTIHPRLLGEGVPLFATPYPETELRLLRCEQYKTGLVQLSYEVIGWQSRSTKDDRGGSYSYASPQPALL
jgi:dihydrofolate reductase